jgi:ABC-type enterochelin transport system permease subunit
VRGRDCSLLFVIILLIYLAINFAHGLDHRVMNLWCYSVSLIALVSGFAKMCVHVVDADKELHYVIRVLGLLWLPVKSID